MVLTERHVIDAASLHSATVTTALLAGSAD